MDYEALRQLRMKTNPFARFMGITLTQIREGYAAAEMKGRPELDNPVGYCHGGALFTLADVAAGTAAISFGRHAVTVSADYHFLKAGCGEGVFIAEARSVHCGRQTIVLQVEIKEKGKEELLGTACFTYHRLDREIELTE